MSGYGHSPIRSPSPQKTPRSAATLQRYNAFSAYQPAFPSPLSQRPLQASVSSSRTGASVANSARTTSSTRTTSTSATSKFSITQAFSALGHQEIDFFDQVISLLPEGAADFGQLKKAYNAVLSSEIETRAKSGADRLRSRRTPGGADSGEDEDEEEEDWDTNLWSCLLSLVKVRGKDWRERWDSVRIALGLEPKSSGEDDDNLTQSQGEESTSTSASATESHPTSVSTDEESRSMALFFNQRTLFREETGSKTPRASRGQDRFGKGLSVGGRHAILSSPANLPYRSDSDWETSTGEEHAGLVAGPSHLPAQTRRHEGRMDDRVRLSAARQHPSSHQHGQVGHSGGASRQSRAGRDGSEGHSVKGKSRDIVQGSPNSDYDTSQLRSRFDRLRLNTGSIEESTSASETDQLNVGGSSRPSSAQKRFQEVVRNSQAERQALRQVKLAQQEEEEERQWLEAARQADWVFAQRLLKSCMGWWMASAQRHSERTRNVEAARNRVVLARSWDRWNALAGHEKRERTRAEHIDQVRCKLGAWRRWRRVLKAKTSSREDQKKESLKTAYHQISKKMKGRIVKNAYSTWRGLYLERVADAVRKGHLQQGAFALWQLRLAKTNILQAQEDELANRYQFRLLNTTWADWTKKTGLKQKERHLVIRVDRQILKEALGVWRKMSMLTELADAFSRRRLERAALTGWIEARGQQDEQRRKEAIAVRWRNRRTKTSAVRRWRNTLSNLIELQGMAEKALAEFNKRRAQKVFSWWLARERETLLSRVKQGRVLEQALSHWKQLHRSLTTSLAQRETTLVQRRAETLFQSALKRWEDRTKNIIKMRRIAMETDRSKTLAIFLGLWRAQLQSHDLSERKAGAIRDYFTQRAAWKLWQERLRDVRASWLVAERDDRLVAQNFAMWKIRFEERQREDSIILAIREKQGKRLQQRVLKHWTERVIERRNLEIEVSEQRKRKVTQAAFYAWVESCLRHDDMLNLMQSYRDVKQEDMLRRTLMHWLATMRASRSRRERAERFVEDRQRALVARVWEKWSDQYAEAVLRSVEYDVMMRRQEYATSRVLQKWIGRTRSLPAIQFRNHQLKTSAIAKWKKSLPGARRARKAAQTDRTRLLGETFAKWFSQTKTRQQLRAAARFGGPSMVRLKTLSSRYGTPTPRSFVTKARRMSSPRPEEEKENEQAGQAPPAAVMVRTRRRLDHDDGASQLELRMKSSTTSTNLSSLFPSPRKDVKQPTLAQLATDSGVGLNEDGNSSARVRLHGRYSSPTRHEGKQRVRAARTPSASPPRRPSDGAGSVSSAPVATPRRQAQLRQEEIRPPRSEHNFDETGSRKSAADRQKDMALASEMLALLRARRRGADS